MEVKYAPEIPQVAAEGPLLRQASELLKDIVGPQPSQPVEAAWARLQDAEGRAVYRLTLKDATGEVFTEFTPADLRNTLLVRVTLPHLYGDLLAIRHEALRMRAQALFAELAVN